MNSSRSRRFRCFRWALAAILLPWLFASQASACPFCTALKPTLSQQREEAQLAALGEFVERKEDRAVFRLHAVLKGESELKKGELRSLEAEGDFKPGSLALLLATSKRSAGEQQDSTPALFWTVVLVDELAYAYVARAPSLREETAARLRYFVKYLEHGDPLVAEDAYLEFAHASYDEVKQIAGDLDAAKIRGWLAGESVPPERKGFYGLALGLAREPHEASQSNVEFLRSMIDQAAAGSGFQSGLDGILGGYLVAAKEQALEDIDRRFLADADANVGHVRHAMNALRFAYEFARDVPPEQLRESLRHLLARPEFAAETITDLARWEDWDSLPTIAALYGNAKHDERPTKRAIIGYLLACPSKEAKSHLERIRAADPTTVEEAEKSLELFGDR